MRIYTAGTGSYHPNFSGWAFVAVEENPLVHYCGCTKGTEVLMKDMAIYQALIWLQGKSAVIYGELAMSGMTKIILEQFPSLVMETPPNDEYKDFCEALAEKGKLWVQEKPVEFKDIQISDTLLSPDEVFSTRYLVKEKFESSLIVQNLSTISKKLEIHSGQNLLR